MLSWIMDPNFSRLGSGYEENDMFGLNISR